MWENQIRQKHRKQFLIHKLEKFLRQPPSQVRVRRRRQQFDYEGHDDPIFDPEQKYRVKFWNYILDTAKTSAQERFYLLNAHNKIFRFMFNITSIKTMKTEQLEDHCKELERALSDSEDKSDICAVDLAVELQSLARWFPLDLTSKNHAPLAAFGGLTIPPEPQIVINSAKHSHIAPHPAYCQLRLL